MNWFDAFQVVSTLLSMCGAAYAWWYANKSEKAKAAAAQAQRLAEEARRQADEKLEATRRLAAEAERQTESLAGIARSLRLQVEGPSWKVESRDGFSYALVNISVHDLKDVHVALEPSCASFSLVGFPCDIPASSERLFSFEPSAGEPSRPTVVVTWVDVDGVKRSWRTVLPSIGRLFVL